MANRHEVLGNICTDIELRKAGEKSVVNIRIATREWGGKSEFHAVTLWGNDAEFAAKYCRKGMKVYAAGPVKTSEYEKEGVTVQKREIQAREFEIAERKQQDDNDGF